MKRVEPLTVHKSKSVDVNLDQWMLFLNIPYRNISYSGIFKNRPLTTARLLHPPTRPGYLSLENRTVFYTFLLNKATSLGLKTLNSNVVSG